MTDGIALAGALVKELARRQVISPDPVLAEAGNVGVHLSFSRAELDGILMKTWDDSEGRVHLSVRWKSE